MAPKSTYSTLSSGYKNGNLPAEENVAVLGIEVSKLLFRQASKLLSLQDKSFHTIQVLVPLLHQLLRLRK